MPISISGGVQLSGGVNLTPHSGSPTPAPSSSGYTSGGYPADATIDKFPFASDANATDVGNLLAGNYSSSGQNSTDNGYASGGSTGTLLNTIQKFPFSSDANSSDVGDLTLSVSSGAGQSSSTHGYQSGGYDNNPGARNNIQKFTFSSDSNATDVGDLTLGRYTPSGQSSSASGYSSGGYDGSGTAAGHTNIIDKFSFSSDGNATDVGDLTLGVSRSAGQSSSDNGYLSGGESPSLSPTASDIINKFPFSSDSNATDVGDLTLARTYSPAGQQG